jgi:hypothetical protein
MTTPKGGRGKKANYKTVPVRCPEPLKFTVHELIRRYHAQEFVPPTAHRPPAELSDSELLASMAALAAEYGKRIPKSTEEQAEEIVDQIIAEMEAANFTPSMQLQCVARIVEKFL